MDITDRLVIVPSRALDDLCDLSSRAAAELTSQRPCDSLASAIHGVVAEVRTHSLVEPSHP